MEIIKHSGHVDCVSYSRSFEWKDMPGAGFSFDCDEQGNLAKLIPLAHQNYLFCLANPDKLTDQGIVKREWTYYEPAEGRCSCGRIVILDYDPATCECGLDYNLSGQLLAPRRFWGEETGEQF